MRVAIATRNAALNAETALLNGGWLRVYSGAQPATPETLTTGQLLAEVRFGDPAFAPAEEGIARSRVMEPVVALAKGKASWARAVRRDGTPVLDGTAGVDDASDFIFNTVEVEPGAQVLPGTITIKL